MVIVHVGIALVVVVLIGVALSVLARGGQA
jgi:hypothetical protein